MLLEWFFFVEAFFFISLDKHFFLVRQIDMGIYFILNTFSSLSACGYIDIFMYINIKIIAWYLQDRGVSLQIKVANIHISPLIWSLTWCKALVTSGELHSTWWFSIKDRFRSPSGKHRIGWAQFKSNLWSLCGNCWSSDAIYWPYRMIFFFVLHQTKLFLRLYSCVNPVLQETRYQLDTLKRNETNTHNPPIFALVSL